MVVRSKKLFLISGILFAVGTFLVLFGPKSNCPETLVLGEAEFAIECAKTAAQREQGLSGRESLATSTGLLFIFEQPGLYGFWMKEMKFPIDIIWLDEEKRIVYVKENATPESYPQSFGPSVPAKYVLEINAGLAGKYGMKAGDTVKFLKLK